MDVNKSNSILLEAIKETHDVYFDLLGALYGRDINMVFNRLMDLNLDENSLGFWVWHIPSGVELYSPRFRESLGYEGVKDFPDRAESWMNAIDPLDKQIAVNNFNMHVLSYGAHDYLQRVYYRKKNGDRIQVICLGKVITWGRGNTPLIMVGAHLDI